MPTQETTTEAQINKSMESLGKQLEKLEGSDLPTADLDFMLGFSQYCSALINYGQGLKMYRLGRDLDMSFSRFADEDVRASFVEKHTSLLDETQFAKENFKIVMRHNEKDTIVTDKDGKQSRKPGNPLPTPIVSYFTLSETVLDNGLASFKELIEQSVKVRQEIDSLKDTAPEQYQSLNEVFAQKFKDTRKNIAEQKLTQFNSLIENITYYEGTKLDLEETKKYLTDIANGEDPKDKPPIRNADYLKGQLSGLRDYISGLEDPDEIKTKLLEAISNKTKLTSVQKSYEGVISQLGDQSLDPKNKDHYKKFANELDQLKASVENKVRSEMSDKTEDQIKSATKKEFKKSIKKIKQEAKQATKIKELEPKQKAKNFKKLLSKYTNKNGISMRGSLAKKAKAIKNQFSFTKSNKKEKSTTLRG